MILLITAPLAVGWVLANKTGTVYSGGEPVCFKS